MNVPLFNGKIAHVDAEDFDRVMAHTWTARQAPNSDRWYAIARIDGRYTRLHRFILNAKPGELIDHEDRDGLNNRRSNLRHASDSQNAMNRKRDQRNRSGFKGVSWHAQTSKWRAVIAIEGCFISLGLHATPEQAARAYDDKAREVFGPYARLNFPRDGEQAA